MTRKIDISITQDEILDILQRRIVEDPYKGELLDLIRAHFSEDYKLTQLYKTLCGISLEPKVKVGEKYWVQVYSLNSWRMNKPLMRDEKIIQEDHVLCEIVEINKYDESPIMVSYLCINDAGEKVMDKIPITEKALTFPEKPIEF